MNVGRWGEDLRDIYNPHSAPPTVTRMAGTDGTRGRSSDARPSRLLEKSSSNLYSAPQSVTIRILGMRDWGLGQIILRSLM